MVQTTSTKFPELDVFLGQLHSRWSREACSALCSLDPGSDDSLALAIFDEELATLYEISRRVNHALRTLLAYVGTQKNRFCKINNLPAEILREIFLSACENGLRWQGVASIIKTCKLWHNILVNDPFAYNTINIGEGRSSLRIAETFAERSLSLPLNITWTDVVGGSRRSQFSSLWEGEFCGQQIARIKTLEYGQTNNQDDWWLYDFPAPQLERLKLLRLARPDEVVDIGEDDVEFLFDTDYHVYEYLFDRNAPNLHTLDLHEIRLAWCEGNYTNLTHIKITFHPELLRQTTIDSDCVTIIFRNSPRLEHVELTNSFHERTWATLSDREIQSPHYAPRPKCTMNHLHTIRIHLSTSYVLYILRAIEITPTVRSIDLRCGSRHKTRRRCLEIFDTDVLPDFIFTNLQSLSFCEENSRTLPRLGVAGTGVLDHHKYSLLIHLPLDNHAPLIDKIAITRHMTELRRIGLPARAIRSAAGNALMKLLVASPAANEVDFLGSDFANMATELGRLLSDTENHPPLSKISHWALFRDIVSIAFRCGLRQRDIAPLKTFFRLLPSGRKTLSVDQHALLGDSEGGLAAVQGFVVDLARLNVVVLERFETTFSRSEHDRAHDLAFKDHHTHCMPVEALWPDGDVPEVVQEVMGETDTTQRFAS